MTDFTRSTTEGGPFSTTKCMFCDRAPERRFTDTGEGICNACVKPFRGMTEKERTKLQNEIVRTRRELMFGGKSRRELTAEVLGIDPTKVRM